MKSRRFLLPLFLLIALSTGWIVSSGKTKNLSSLKSDEQLEFFDTAARFDAVKRRWVVPVHARVSEPASSVIRKATVEIILEQMLGVEIAASQRANFDRRVLLFLADNERGKRIGVRWGDRVHIMPVSEADGHIRGEITLPADEVASKSQDGRLLFLDGVAGNMGSRQYQGRVHLVPARGLSVISDIDDTIKITEVRDRKKMIQNTFLEDFKAVPGMADLYTSWYAEGVSIHFVSSSPWQLHGPLREMARGAGFPPATFSLKSVRLTDKTLLNLFKKGTETKPLQIEPILEAYPERSFILIGDSGEQDPEVYGELLRKHPRQVARVFIRNVTDEKADGERMKKAFRGLDSSKWRLFENPSRLELPKLP